MLLWPQEEASRVVPAWRDWTRTAPEEVTTSLRLMSFPPLPELPPFLSGRRVLVVDGAVSGTDDATAAEILAPLRALAPELDTFAPMPAADLAGVHMDPPQPVPAVGDHRVLGELPDKALTALLEHVGADRTLMFAELRQLGGAVGRPAADGGCVSHVDGEFALFTVAIAPTPELAAAGLAAAHALTATMQPWAVEGLIPTFSDATPEDGALWPDRDRLRRTVEAVDPGRVFLAHHSAP
jgi:hypothetical protein